MDEIEESLKESPLYNSLPLQEKKDLVEELFHRYLEDKKSSDPSPADSP